MPISLSDKRILLVDDSAIMRMILVMNLRRLFRIKITEAVNGMEAIARLAEGTFDLVLTDINMPELDGLGLIRHIREVMRSDIPILIITTRGESRDRDRGMALGANGYVTKPVNMKELVWQILQILGGSRQGKGYLSNP